MRGHVHISISGSTILSYSGNMSGSHILSIKPVGVNLWQHDDGVRFIKARGQWETRNGRQERKWEMLLLVCLAESPAQHLCTQNSTSEPLYPCPWRPRKQSCELPGHTRCMSVAGSCRCHLGGLRGWMVSCDTNDTKTLKKTGEMWEFREEFMLLEMYVELSAHIICVYSA